MKRILFIHVIVLLCVQHLYAQNAIVGAGFSSGWGGGGCPTGNGNFTYLGAGAGSTYIVTRNPNGTGNQYFRFGVDWGGTTAQLTNTIGSDVLVSPNTTYSLNTSCTTSGALYINCPNTTDNYVFKTLNAGTNPTGTWTFFRVQGAVQSVSSVTRAPSGTVFPGQAVTVTANLSGSFATGQGVYLRYSTNSFTSSTVVAMTGSGTSYTATIPASANSAGAGLSYYVFTSGNSGPAADGSNADLYTINLNNNGGANYSYTVASGWTTAAAGNWGTAATWTANAIPPTATSMGLVTINHAVTQDVSALASSIVIGASGTLTATANTLTISNNTTGTNFTNSGTMALSSAHAVTFAGTATHTISGTCAFNNINTTTGINFGTSSTINGNFSINAGGFVSVNAPTYGASSTLTYNTGAGYAASTEWTANALTGQGIPNNVTISTAATSVNFGASTQYRRLRGNLTISASTTLALSTAVGGDLRVGGNWTNSGTFTANSRAVFFDGSAGQTINATATGFAFLFISNTTANVTAAAAITVASRLTIDANARLDMAANTLTLTGSTSTVNGFLRSAGTITGATTTSLTFSSTGTYEHNYTASAGTVPTATWSAGSTCAIIGYTASFAPGGISTQTFSNFTWNCVNQGTANCQLSAALTTINGNLSILATGTTGSLRYNAGTPAAPTLTIGGNLIISGGTFDLTSGASTPTINLGGNLVQTGGTLARSGGGLTTVNFNKSSGTQTITQSAGTITGTITWNVGTGASTNTVQLLSNFAIAGGTFNCLASAKCDFQTYVLSGSGTFAASTGSTLITANTAGINTSGATGSVQTTTRTFTNTGVNYTFNGGSAQSAGTAIGAAASIANLTVNNSAGVTLSSNVQSLTGTLSLTSGSLSLSTFDLNLASAATISGASASKYVVTGSTGQLKKAALTTAFTFPVGNSAYNPIILTNTGTSDTYGVIVSDGAIPNATVSSAAVNRRWIVTEGTAGGGNIAVTAQYNTGETGGTFTTGSQVYVGLYVPTTWTTTTTTVSGSNPFTAAGSGFTQSLPTSGTTAYFAIGNEGMSLAIPTITTTTIASSITNNTSSTGGQGIAGSALSAKGVVYSTAAVSTSPTLSNSVLTDGATTSANFTSNLTGLTPETHYYVRAYATNAAGTGYGPAINFRTLSNPATAQATGMSASATASGELTISWTGATWPSSGATQAGYALIYSTGSPTLSSANGAAPAAGVGTIITITATNLPTAPSTSYVLSGLAGGTTYNFLVVPFTWDGTNSTTYNYLTTSAPTTAATAIGNPSITTTTAISAITSSSAASGGSGVSANGGTISAKGVVWNTTTAPTTANSSTNDGSGTGSFSSSLSSLSPQTLYYVRSYSTNQVATAYGNELSFYTPSNEPTAAAGSFTATANGSSQIDLSWSAAAFPGTGASNNGYIILRRIDSTNPTTSSVTDGVAPGSLSLPSGTTLVTTIAAGSTTSYNHTSLSASTQYNYIIIPFTWDGTNGATYNYYLTSAPTADATTAAGLPTVDVTTAASSITNNSASSGGSSLVEGGSAITDKGVAYNTSTLPTISNSTTNDGSGTANFSSSLTGLSAQTLYYVRAYVTNSSGTGYGNEITFRTLSNPATAQASSLSASNSASGQLTLSWTGATFPSSGATQGGYALIYSTGTPTLSSANGAAPTAGVGTLVTITPTNLPTAPTTSYVLSGLTGGTTYSFLLVPFTWDGTNATTYNYLTTSAPTTTGTAVTNGSVTTTAASAITNTTASSGGSAINAGGGTISAKGVVWNTSTAPTTANNSTNDGTGTSSFSSSLTSLNAQTLYYYRAYATNDVGTAYGSESSFYTLSNAPTIQASGLSASATSSSNINLNWSAAAFPASGATTTGYVLLRATSPNTPSLGNGNGAAPAAGANTTIVSSSISGASTSTSSSALAAATTYNYLLVPFTWDGVNASTYNYLTSSAPSASGTTLAATPTAQPTALVFSAVTSSTITTSWTSATGAPSGYIVLRSSTASPDTDPVAGTTYSAGNTLGNATVVYAGSAVTTGAQAGLVDGTTYYYEVFSYNGSGSTINYLIASPLSGTQATTAISAPVATAATSAAATSFTANWGAVSGAASYLLDVSTNPCFASFGSASTATEGFAGGTTAPSGWTFTAIGATYTTAGNFGAASPALTLDATGDRVLTNQLSGAAASQLSFWLRGNGTNSLSALLVEGTTDGTNWVTIENITNSIPTTGTTKTYNFSSTPLLPCGMIQFRFTYTKNAGNLAFDDVSITSASSTPDFVSGYNGLSVSGTSASVTGLTSSTTYYYRVRAVGTNSTSGNSNIITAATLNDPNTADYRSVASGNYTSSSTWEYNSIGSTWVAATQAPTSASNVNIQAAHTVTLDASRSIDSGKTLTIAGVLDAGANNISGAGVVAMAGTSTIITSSASGLAGALQVTTPSSCTFATGAKFHFTGTAVNTGFASFAGVGSFTFYNLVWAGTTSITLDKNIRITTLDFTNDGLFYLGNFDLYISSSGVINGSPFSSSKMFVTEGTGSLFRFITTGVWTAFTWPIGETSGTADYSPVTINALTGNAAASAYIGFRVTDSAEPNNGLASNYITRYWTYTTANLTAGSSWSNTTFGYTASDIVGTETLLKANVYNAATTTWTEFSTSSAASNTLTFTSGASTTTVLTTNNITARVDPPLYYRSASSGSWGTASTWLVSTDASFVSPAGIAATSAPTAANSIGITILAGHSITSSASVSADQLTIQTGGSLEMTNNALTISNGTGTDVTVETGATLLLSGTSTMTINASAAIQVDGLYKVSSTSAPVVTTSGTTTIGAIGTYEHARDAGIIPTCTWTTGSTCLITGTGNNAPTGLAQSFHHFTVNTTLTNSVNCSGLLQTVNGKLKITTNNASFGWRLTGTTNYTLNVADSLIITNGILDVASGGATGTINASGPIVMNGSSSQLTKTGAAAMVINCNSNLVQNAGIIEFNAGGSSNTTWNIKGDVVQGGTIQRTNGGTHTLNFNKASGTQTWTQTGSFGSGALIINVGNSTTNTVQLLSNISLGASAHTFNVTNGATFNMGPYTLSGAASGFVLGATGAIKLGNANGIVTAPTASGNVQTSTRTFPATASYFYNGTANQVTGNALPATLTTTGNLNIEAASGVTVTLTTNNTTVPTFNLLSGLFAAGTGQNINLSNGGVVNATGGDFATGASAGNITATGSAAFNGNCNPYNVYASGGVNFGAQTVSIQNGGTFRINAGGFVNTNAPFYSTGATLQYNSSATYGRALEWSATSGRGYPHHVQISNNTILDPANTAGAQANTPLRTAGNLTIDSGSAMYMDFGGNNMTEDLVVLGNLNLTGALSGSQASGSDVYVSGNWQNNGTSTNFYPNNRAVFLNGTSTQTISGTNTSFPAFPYLFIDKTAGAVSLSRDIQVTESLTFSSANTVNIEANGFTVYVSKNTTTAIDRQGSGHVVGNLRRAVATGTNTYAFPIGGTSAYTPVSMALNNVTVAGSLTLATTAGDHPQISTSGIDASKSVNRYYTITNTGVTLTSYSPTFTFVAGDLDASVNTSSLLVGRYNSGWTYPAMGTRTSTTTEATALTAFGDFAIAECKSPAAFTITGGGNYCSGGAGIAVGLDGSEAWVNYQLQRDGVDVGSPLAGTGSALSFGNQTAGGVYTAVALNAANTSCSTAQTGSATISINPTVTPSISINSTTTTTICSGSSVTFNATPQFGGTSPSYQWKLNGSNVGSDASSYTNGALVNGDVVSCVLTSSEACPTAASVNSNAITMTVLAYETPSITIASSSGTSVCGGNEVVFTSSTTFAGLTSAYQWKINGVNIGSNSDTLSSTTLSNGDQVSCVLTSDYQCLTVNSATSNTLTISVTAAPQVDAGAAVSSCGTSPVVVSNGASVSNAVSYSWSENGAGSITAGGTTLTPTYTPAAGDVGTTVTLTLTANGNSPCAAMSDVVSVSITPLILFYVDADGDGFGNPLLAPVAACTAPIGRVANNTDCCDSNADVNPATEWWADVDGDGFGSFVANGGCISGCSGEAQNIPYYPAVHGGVPYVVDCNDGNITVYPGANELCQNSSDDDCDALIDEGCSGIINDTYANATLANTTNPNAIFPNCLVYNGTTLNADISPQANPANVASGGGRDVWYRFVAPSTAVRIRAVPVGFDAVLELRTAMPSNTQVDVENANATIGGVEILNRGGLTVGQTYYVAVRNFNATAGGSFTLCISPLMPSGCAYVVPAGGFSLCSTFKAIYRGATNYTFNFTGTGGNAASPFVTTSATSTGLIALNTPSLDLRNSGIYSCRVDANYLLQNGAGVTEPMITVLGSTASSNCSGITISTQPQMVVRSNQVCPAVLNRSAFLVSLATNGSSQACGAISYTYRFTQVTDCSGSTTSGLPFTVNTTGTTPYLSLAAAFPAASGYPLASVGYWRVEVRPNFSYGAGTYGPSRIISVNNTSSTMAMDAQGFADSERSGDALNSSLGWNIYPNPSDGRSLQLQSPEESVIQMRIHNAVGALVYDAQISMQVQQPARVDFAQPLPAGVYLIELTTSNQTQTLRWVVE
jgi:hypothetical protein